MTKKPLYVVEKILDKRKKRNKFEYLIKWQNYGEADNTWESADNFLCPDLVQEFEEKFSKKEKVESKKLNDKSFNKKRKNSDDSVVSLASTSTTVNTVVDKEENKKSEDLLIPEEIVGANILDGELKFLVKWKNDDEGEIIPAKIANVKYPQIVIKFYEKRLNWNSYLKN